MNVNQCNDLSFYIHLFFYQKHLILRDVGYGYHIMHKLLDGFELVIRKAFASWIISNKVFPFHIY